MQLLVVWAYYRKSEIESNSHNLSLMVLNSKTSISCYSPHNDGVEEDVDRFNDNLRSIVTNVPVHTFPTLLGDFNARLGPEATLFTYNMETNHNGVKLADFIEEFNLVATNTRFMKPKNKLWRFDYPNSQRGQLDCKKEMD